MLRLWRSCRESVEEIEPPSVDDGNGVCRPRAVGVSVDHAPVKALGARLTESGLDRASSPAHTLVTTSDLASPIVDHIPHSGILSAVRRACPRY